MDDELAKKLYVSHPRGTSVPQFRAVIPDSLRPYADGQKVFKRTLGKDPARQRERYATLLSEYEMLLANARAAAAQDTPESPHTAGRVRLLKTLTEEDRERLNEFAESWQTRALEWHDDIVPDMSSEDIDDFEKGLRERLEMLQLGVRRMAPPPDWEEEVSEHLELAAGIRLSVDCQDRRPFFMRLLGEEIAAVKATLARFGGTYVPTPPLNVRQPPTENTPPISAPQITSTNVTSPLLATCLDDWLETTGKRSKSRKEFESIFRAFTVWVAKAEGIASNAAQVAHIRGRRQIHEWLEAIARERPIERPTLNKHLAAVRAILNNAASRGSIESNPALGVKLATLALRGTKAGRVERSKAKKSPWDAAELTRYFSLFDYWLGDDRVPRAVSYWLPLCLFMFGARPQEIATLMRDDVRIDERGQYWLHIFLPVPSPEGLERRPKHDASFRHLPVPPKLMALGFAEYVASVPNGAWLFPCKAADAKPGAEGVEDRAAQTLNYLNPYLRQVVGVTDSRKTTYSLRHAFHDELRRARVPTEVQNALTGHAGANSNAGVQYYGSTWYPEEPLLEAMNALQHYELLPDDFPTWRVFRDSPTPSPRPKLVKKS
jgi:integrase